MSRSCAALHRCFASSCALAKTGSSLAGNHIPTFWLLGLRGGSCPGVGAEVFQRETRPLPGTAAAPDWPASRLSLALHRILASSRKEKTERCNRRVAFAFSTPPPPGSRCFGSCAKTAGMALSTLRRCDYFGSLAMRRIPPSWLGPTHRGGRQAETPTTTCTAATNPWNALKPVNRPWARKRFRDERASAYGLAGRDRMAGSNDNEVSLSRWTDRPIAYKTTSSVLSLGLALFLKVHRRAQDPIDFYILHHLFYYYLHFFVAGPTHLYICTYLVV